MKSNIIGIIPALGYNPAQNTSVKSLQWLEYISKSQNIYIQHAKNGGELKVDKYFVDGYSEFKKTIYEFHGCFFHGHDKCFDKTTWNPF